MSERAPARLEVEGVSRSFGAVQAVRDVSLQIAPGEIHGLCGHNGAGKSTLINMLAGVVTPDAGQIRLDGETVELHNPRDAQRAGVACVDQELSLVPALTVAENVALGSVNAGFLRRSRHGGDRARELMAKVGLHDVSPAEKAQSLSLGRRQLVEIARALGRESRLLILDEPTATLTDVEIEQVFAAVRGAAEGGCAVIFVSHRLGEVLQLCDRVTVMRDGRVVEQRMTAQLTAEELVEAMLGEHLEPAPHRPGGIAAEGRTLEIDRLAVPGRLADLTLQLSPGRIYGLAGQVGAGASVVLRALAGLVPEATGRAVLNGRALPLGDPAAISRAGVGFISNDRKGEGLFLSLSIAENLTATQLGSLGTAGGLSIRRERRRARELSEAAGVPADRVLQPVGVLSGGNQQKVLVGRYLLRPDIHVLLVDEPTRGVDVGGRAAIHELLRDAARAGQIVLFASSDLDELLELAETIVTMRGGSVISAYSEGVSRREVLSDLTHRTAAAA